MRDAALGALALAAPTWWSRSVRAFGTAPDTRSAPGVEKPVARVLELFLIGGLSPWETFYCVPERGMPAGQAPGSQLWAFDPEGEHGALTALRRCNREPSGAIAQPFAYDDAGTLVSLGPFLHPLWSRPDITERMRVVVQQHALQPHEAAVPLALTGKGLGSTGAGMGAHVERFFRDREGAAPAPRAYVLGAIESFNARASLSTGLHPGSSRPFHLRTTDLPELARRLQRPGAGGAAAARDALAAAYLGAFRERSALHGSPRDAALELELALARMQGSEALEQRLLASELQTTTIESCGQSSRYETGEALQLAAGLLTASESPARYVAVLDSGLVGASGGGGYDTHVQHCDVQATNTLALLDGLLALIAQPGEADPGKLDLDDTLIVIHSEFGRGPLPENGSGGRDHFPYAYTTTWIGGPIAKSQRGVAGALGDDGMSAAGSVAATPAQARMAMLLALGAWPLGPEAFGVADVPDAVDEADAVRRTLAHFFGWSA